MAQTNDWGVAGFRIHITKSTVIPAAGNSVILDVPTSGVGRLVVSLKPTVNAIDALVVQARFYLDGPLVTITSAITVTPGGLILAASGTLATLALNATGWFMMDTRGLFAVTLLASGTVNDSTSVFVTATGV